jgi:hypothetical protein
MRIICLISFDSGWGAAGYGPMRTDDVVRTLFRRAKRLP